MNIVNKTSMVSKYIQFDFNELWGDEGRVVDRDKRRGKEGCKGMDEGRGERRDERKGWRKRGMKERMKERIKEEL